MPVLKGTGRRCSAVKADSRQCKATALKGAHFCFFHDPTKSPERAAARRAGGVERSHRAAVLPLSTPDRPLATVADVVGLLAETINHVRRGQLDTKIANCVGYICGILLKALSTSDLEGRLANLEAILRRRPQAWEFSFDKNGEVEV